MTCYYDYKDVMVRDAEMEDIEYLKDHMKEADKNEIWASDHFTPEEALRHALEVSTYKFTFLYKGEVVGMFGVNPETLLSNRAVVWMLTSDRIENMKKTFAKVSKEFIRSLQRIYPTLYNLVDSRHTTSIHWLKWAGAEILPAKKYGKENIPFHPFVFGGQL